MSDHYPPQNSQEEIDLDEMALPAVEKPGKPARRGKKDSGRINRLFAGVTTQPFDPKPEISSDTLASAKTQSGQPGPVGHTTVPQVTLEKTDVHQPPRQPDQVLYQETTQKPPAPGMETIRLLPQASPEEPTGKNNQTQAVKTPAVQTADITIDSVEPAAKRELQPEAVVLLDLLEADTQRSWTHDELLLVEQVAGQLTLTLENARLFEQNQAALNETETLYKAGAQINASSTFDDIFSVLRQHTVLGKANKLVSLLLFDRPMTDTITSVWLTPIAHWTSLPPENFQSQYLVQQFPAVRYLSPSEIVAFEDIENDGRLNDSVRRVFLGNFESKSVITAPLFVGGKWIGFILAGFGDLQHFDQGQNKRLLALTGQAAVAVQNILSLDESRRRANQLQTAAEIARDTTGSLTLDELLARFVNLLCERFSFYHASIFLVDESGENAYVRESTGAAGAEMKRRGHKLAVGSRSVIGQTTYKRTPVILNDLSQKESQEIHRFNPLLLHTRAELGIPLKIGDRLIGALDVQSTQPNVFSDEYVSILQTLADQIAIAVENAQSYELVNQAMEETQKADRLKSQFLANMSHELRTPLNSIIGFSRVILKGIDGPITDLQKQDLSSIYNSGQHLLGLINDVLDLSKIEAGKMELSLEENVNLVDIIKGVMSTTVGLVKDKSIQLIQEIDEPLPLLQVDPTKIRQVLLNLLSNAAKFTEKGSITVQARAQVNSQGLPEVYVAVVDTGPGIARENQGKLFKAFSQVDGSLTRKTGGSGLGLSICQHLIQMHAGQIGLESEPDKGSTFYFILPVETGATTPITAPILSHPTGIKPTAIADVMQDEPRQQAILLAIEPDTQITELYRRFLAQLQIKVISFSDLNQAADLARKIKPELITLDVGMQTAPGASQNPLDGWKLLHTLKTDPQTRHIPVVICSMLDEEEKARRLGADGYLLKPILADDLVKIVQELSILK